MILSCILIGENFSPSALEKSMNIFFHQKNEKGEIATIGRFKGRPLPYGSCVVCDESNQEIVMDFLEKNLDILKKNGIDNIFLRLDVIYESQCNFELDPNFLSRIVKFSIPLSISCYENN